MLLQEVFDQLTYGELSNLSIGGAEEGGISAANMPKVISHINLALMDLNAKFKLSTKEAIIEVVEGQTKYTLDSDIQSILEVYDESGNAVSMDDPNDPNSIYKPSWDTIQIPINVITERVYLIYQAKAQKVLTTADAATTEILLPDILLEPLLAYVAGRISTSRGSDEGIKIGQTQMNKYEFLCMGIKAKGILNSSTAITNNKLEIGGWV